MTRTEFSALHPSIVKPHILARLDGSTLASLASCSTTLRHLISANDKLWSNICQSTWPSTNSPILNQLMISSFPPRAFFSQAFPLPTSNPRLLSSSSSKLPSKLISAVDIHYKGKLVFTKVQETETSTKWFMFGSFRIVLVDEVPIPAKHPDTCEEIVRDTTLTWILIDPIGRQAVNLSSHKAVTAKRNCVTGEVQLRFDSILAAGHVKCGIIVTCGGSEDDRGMHLREVSLEMENVDGLDLHGEDSLVILHAALEGERGSGRVDRVAEGRRRYEEFMKLKRERRERRERKLRIKGTMDMLCHLAFEVLSIFVCFLLLFSFLHKIIN